MDPVGIPTPVSWPGRRTEDRFVQGRRADPGAIRGDQIEHVFIAFPAHRINASQRQAMEAKSREEGQRRIRARNAHLLE
jgi:hypothetical protein